MVSYQFSSSFLAWDFVSNTQTTKTLRGHTTTPTQTILFITVNAMETVDSSNKDRHQSALVTYESVIIIHSERMHKTVIY